jgi:hypothetical protein
VSLFGVDLNQSAAAFASGFRLTQGCQEFRVGHGMRRRRRKSKREPAVRPSRSHHRAGLGQRADAPSGLSAWRTKPEDSASHRNGTGTKTVLTDDGPLPIDVPRDRECTFEPQFIPKRERRFTAWPWPCGPSTPRPARTPPLRSTNSNAVRGARNFRRWSPPGDGRGPRWLALRNITAEWERVACYWRPAMNQFAILYEDRFPRPNT